MNSVVDVAASPSPVSLLNGLLQINIRRSRDQKDVARFQITMNDAAFVSIIHRKRQLFHHRSSICRGDWLTAQPVSQCSAFDKLQCQKRQRVVFTNFVNLYDARVLQMCDSPRFLFHSG